MRPIMADNTHEEPACGRQEQNKLIILHGQHDKYWLSNPTCMLNMAMADIIGHHIDTIKGGRKH